MAYLPEKGLPQAEFRSPDDFTAAYTSTTTITLTGLPFTPDSSQLVYIKRVTSSNTSFIYVNGADGITLTISSGVVTIYGAGTPFASGDVYEVGINGQKKSYDNTLDSSKVVVQNPRSSLPESIADTTNVADGTYYPSATGKEIGDYEHLSITGKLIDGAGETTTLTVEVTNDEDTAGDWVQIYGYDAKNDTTVNSISATNQTTTYAWSFDVANFEHIRYKIAATAATNTIIIKSRLF